MIVAFTELNFLGERVTHLRGLSALGGVCGCAPIDSY